MTEAGRVLRQALTLGLLGLIVAAAVHLPLVRRFARGEFRESFFPAAEYPGIRLVTLDEAEELWRTDAGLFIDARRPALYEEGHVPRARNLPAVASGRMDPVDLLEIARDKILVVYCEGGDCQSSLLLAKRLHGEGFRDIRVLTGGWTAWKTAGLPEGKGHGQE